MIELSAESDTPLRATGRAFIPRGALAGACVAGALIGLAEWLLSGAANGLASLGWTMAFFAALSAVFAILALCAAKLRLKLDPLWLWGWSWLAFYAVVYANLILLPQQGILTGASIGLSLAFLALAGIASWALVLATRRIFDLNARSRLVAHPAELLSVLAAITAVLVIPIAQSQPDLGALHSPRAPSDVNTLVILIDTLRADRVSAYGYDRPLTPRIDALASEGVRFDAAYSSSSWTIPAVASLFSGLPLSRHRAGSVQTPFEMQPTLAQELSAAGVVTAGFSSNPLVSPLYGFERGFQTFVSYKSGLVHPMLELCVGTGRILLGWATGLERMVYESSGEDWDRMVVELSKTWLQAHATDRFFLYIHLFAPHGPYMPPESFRERWVDAAYSGREHQSAEGGHVLAQDELRNLLERYDAEVSYADSLVGEILGRLAELGLTDSTAVFVTSDHGEAFGEHGYWDHGKALYAEETHIPLVARVPGGPTGIVVDDPVSIQDLYSTILDLAGVREPATLSSVSLKRALQGDLDVPARPVFSEVLEDGERHLETVEAVALGRVRLIHNVSLGKMELFDRSADPTESRPLRNPEVASMLEAYFAPSWWHSAKGATARKIDLAEEDVRRLQSLGYVR